MPFNQLINQARRREPTTDEIIQQLQTQQQERAAETQRQVNELFDRTHQEEMKKITSSLGSISLFQPLELDLSGIVLKFDPANK